MKQSSLSLTGVEDHPGWFKKGGYLSRLAALVCFIHFCHWANGEKMKLSALLLVFQEKCWCSPSGWNRWRFLLSLLLGAYWYCLQSCSLALRYVCSSLCSYSQI